MYIVPLSLVAIILISYVSHVTSTTDCRYPDMRTLSRRLARLNRRFNARLSDNLSHQCVSSVSLPETLSDMTRPTADRQCPKVPVNGARAGIEERSTCPWYYIVTRDLHRYPVEIVEARCKCEKCILSSNQCESVNYNINVLRRGACVGGEFQFRPTCQRVAVGCTCAHPRI